MSAEIRSRSAEACTPIREFLDSDKTEGDFIIVKYSKKLAGRLEKVLVKMTDGDDVIDWEFNCSNIGKAQKKAELVRDIFNDILNHLTHEYNQRIS